MTQKKATRKPKPSASGTLARAGDPLVLANGEIIEPEPDEELEESPDSSLPQTAVPFKAYRPIARRVLNDLRAPTNSINVACVVCMYTLLGISDSEICEATGLDGSQVMRVRDARIYSEVFENIMRELINANSEYIECRIASYSGRALDNIAHIATHSKKENNKLFASKDLLDRAGHRPQDNASRQNTGMNELHIVITGPKDNVDVRLDLNPEDRSKSNGHSS